MANEFRLHHPWFVAVWPGMGHVAVNAGVYLLAKLEMTGIAEFEAPDLFDIDQVEVKNGLVQPVRRPRNRCFVWIDPKKQHDIVLFVGEAQPPLGRYRFCRQLLEYAKQLGVERVITFAAMATGMNPADECRVFAAATNEANLQELEKRDLTILEDGHIGGLNGVLLGAAAEDGLPGACLLGEMPHIFAQLPFPKASLAILEVFAPLAGINLDLGELAEQSRMVEEKLGELLDRVQDQVEQSEEGDEEEDEFAVNILDTSEEDEAAASVDKVHIESLFDQTRKDRSKAFELKQELDRLGVFKEYEDRFLDLFKKSA